MTPSSSSGIHSDPDAILEHCEKAIERGDFCLVLGSGASQDAGLPTWEELAVEFARRVDGTGPARSEISSGQATWVIECVRGALGEADYRNHLQIALYGTEAFDLDARTFTHLAAYPLARLAVASRLHQGSHAVDRRSGARLPDATAGHAFDVLTYNLDCVLEFAIRKLGYRSEAIVPRIGLDDPSYRFPFGPERSPWSRPLVRVFHPHGVLPPGERNYSDDPSLLNTLPLVMSAEDYEVRGGAADIWQNSLQLAAFTQRTCLFYGFSFADPSVRQLLRLAGRLRSNESSGTAPRGHVAFLREPGPFDIPTRSHWEAALRHFGISHVFWSDPSRETRFRDQISMLDRICQRVDAPRLRERAD